MTTALLDNQPVSAVYKGQKLQKLSPLALVVRGNVLYLAATRDEKAEVKHFALHRFQSVALLFGEAFNQPVAFDIDALLAQGWGDFQDAIEEKIIKLQCWCDLALKNHLVEMPLTQKQWIDFSKPVNGRYLLTVSLPYTWQLYQWLLSQGSRLQVIAPEPRRRGMLENYA